jgi:hypothetical protein
LDVEAPPRTTTDVYSHLAPHDLRAEIDKLSFRPKPDPKSIVYRLCDRGELRHTRIAAAIRVRPADLAAFIAARRWPRRSISL